MASVAAPVARRVIPGRCIPEGVTPESGREGSIQAWLESHAGKVSENAAAYAGKMEGGGFDCLYNLEFGHNDLVALGIPGGHARTYENHSYERGLQCHLKAPGSNGPRARCDENQGGQRCDRKVSVSGGWRPRHARVK